MQEDIKTGFISVVGRPNAGKSSLINALIKSKLSMVSKKANATRKRTINIHMHKKHQLIFVDTPGLHETERLLNQFMLEEALKAMGDCDLVLFLAPASDKLDEYEKFLKLYDKKPHILVLTKTDTVKNEEILAKISQYQVHQDRFKALIPLSVKRQNELDMLCDEIVKLLPAHPYMYDPDMLTTQNLREIFKEYIREAIFENTSEEIPYFADVIVNDVKEEDIVRVDASIVVEKGSQKGIMIGKGGATLKRIGRDARVLMERMIENKVFLKLQVIVRANWSKNKKDLLKFGYNF